MNPVTIALISLRGLALSMTIAGRVTEAEQLFRFADFVAAGLATDEQMRKVADLLADREATSQDIVRILENIQAERAELHQD